MMEKKTIVLVMCIVLEAISSLTLVEAQWRSPANELTQQEAETAMIMAMLDLPAMDMGKRKSNTNQNNQQPKRNKPDSGGDRNRAGTIVNN